MSARLQFMQRPLRCPPNLQELCPFAAKAVYRGNVIVSRIAKAKRARYGISIDTRVYLFRFGEVIHTSL